ncbi:MAG: type II toxin-antitoxin system HicB family antitoxin [Candidatus Freyarchaeota archaeon]
MRKLVFTMVVERDEDGCLIASVPELPGCHTHAWTLDELVLRVKEAIELYLEEETEIAEEAKKRELVGIQFVTVSEK